MRVVMLAWAALMLMGCAAERKHGHAHGEGAWVESGFVMREVEVEGRRMPYVMYVPSAYWSAGEKSWPLIVFLHGMGECGTDGLRQMAQGLMQAVQREPQRWPAIIVAPQKPEKEKEWSAYDDLVMAMVRETERAVRVDRDRVALTGLSQGGAGTWAIGAAHPEVWSCLAPVCGYGDPKQVAPRVIGLPVWAFHGEADDIVSPEQTRVMAAAIDAEAEKAGVEARVRMSIYPGVNHGSWDRAYGEAELAGWMLSQRRGK